MRQVVELARRRAKEAGTENGKVRPLRRKPNRATLSREHLTPLEVGQHIAAAHPSGRHQSRDRALIA
jgi:hypothetical protein